MEVQLNTKLFTDTREIHPGVIIGISTNQKKPTWYLVKVEGRWIQTSLGSEDYKKAYFEAIRRYGNFEKSGDRNDLKSDRANRHAFEIVAREWLSLQKKDVGNKTRNIKHYLIPFFEKEKKIRDWTKITDAMLEEYLQWRTDYWNTGIGLERRRNEKSLRGRKLEEPSAATHIREIKSTLRPLIDYAGRYGYFGKNKLPEIDLPDDDGEERPAFSKEQFQHLYNTAETWITETDNPKTIRRRQLLRDMIYVVRWTGVRPTHEPLQIRWCDLKFDLGFTQISKNTKTGERQASFLYMEAYHYLKAMRKRYEDHCALLGKEVDDTALVFQTLEGEGISDWAGIFRDLLVRADLKTPAGTLPFTLYSLRHTFATQALLEQISPVMLAIIMGTSVRMLEEHYAHLTSGAVVHWAKERAKLQQQEGNNVEIPEDIKRQIAEHQVGLAETFRKIDIFNNGVFETADLNIAFSNDWLGNLTSR